MKPAVWVPSVSTIPGLMELTRIFLDPSSFDNTPVIASREALVAVYTATKASLDAITGVLSKELGSRKIRVNSINPGIVETEGTHTAGFIGSDFEKGLVAQTPLGRRGQPGDKI